MSSLPLLIILGCFLPLYGIAIELPLPGIALQPPNSSEVSPHRFLYRDHHDGRIVAVVEARLQPSTSVGDVVRLELHISAHAPEVQPAVGWEQLTGSNRTTALDLERLKTGGLLTFGIADSTEGWRADTATYLRTLQWMPLLEHRQESDGSISAAVPTRRHYLTQLIATSGPLRTGEHEIAVLVAKTARLIIHYQHMPGITRILDIHDPLRPLYHKEP
jgi:hypothetical protein